jgi:hypothetical protein
MIKESQLFVCLLKAAKGQSPNIESDCLNATKDIHNQMVQGFLLNYLV